MTTYFGKFAKKALPVAVSMALLPTATVFAADDSAEQVERIEVTGSRIKRIDMEGAAPITVLDAASISKTGVNTVGDALRNSSLNSFGSYGGGANNAWSSQSTVQLKGGSSAHTLTLLDGQRMAKSPVLNGGASNLNTIPMAAVERIEILSDGASAVYGTDAIAGVVNVILKKDYEGMEFTARNDQHTHDGGDATNFSFTGGTSSDKGQLVFTMEHYQNDNILMDERDYLKGFLTPGGDPTSYQDWVNINYYGRTLTQGGAGGWVWEHPFQNDDLSCADVYGDTFIGPLNDLDYPGDTNCSYNYGKRAAYTSTAKRDNTMVNYSYELTDDIVLKARAYWAKNETKDISAPVPGKISIPQGLPAYTTEAGYELTELKADPYAAMLYRFDTQGDRVAEFHDSVYDFLFALEGSEEDFDWNVSANYNKYTAFTWGTGYLLTDAVNDAVGSMNEETGQFEGWDPRDPNSELPGGIIVNSDKRMWADSLDLSGGVSFVAAELPSGDMGAYVGVAYREERLDSQVDALSAADKVYGSNGGSGGYGERDLTSAFFELAIPVLDELEMNVAARYDDYSDFGSTFNPQVSARYTFSDDFFIRASYGTGFRAPTLPDLYQGDVTGFRDVTDYVSCYEDSGIIDGCNTESNIAVTTGGNKELQPEESTSYNFGMVWEATDNITVKADYWELETTDLIEQLNPSELMKTQARLNKIADETGTEPADISTVYPNTSITMAPSGRIDSITSALVNIGKASRKGLDITVNADFETEIGEFDVSLAMNNFLEYKYSYTSNGMSFFSEDEAGLEDTPDLRMNLTVGYTNGDHSVNYFGNLTGAQDAFYTEGEGEEAEVIQYNISSYIVHSLSYNYQTPFNSSITVGVNNLTDEEPRFYNDGKFNGSLYSVYGRSYYLSFKQSF